MLRIDSFAGEVPKLSENMIADNGASFTMDCKLFSGEIRPWRQPLLQAAGASGAAGTATKAGLGSIRSLFRQPVGLPSTDRWLNWLTDVDVVRSPTANDAYSRLYYAGDGEPRMTTVALAMAGVDYPSQWFVWGVYAAVTAPTVTPSGGSGTTETRAYVTTFVTQYGEESAPSPAGTGTGYPNATWNLSGLEDAPPNSGTISAATYSSGLVTVTVNTTRGLRVGEKVTHASVTGMTELNGSFAITAIVDATHYKVAMASAPGAYVSGGTWTRDAPHNTSSMKRRIYRTVPGQAGTNYYFVAEMANVATTTYADTVASTTVVTQGILPSAGWVMPPASMAGVVAMPNGMLAGFDGNEVCFCEPYLPHAWPVAYRQSTANTIAGLAVLGSTLIVPTLGKPYLFTGASPDAISSEQVDIDEPCVARRSICVLPGRVVWASLNGLMSFTSGGPEFWSAGIVTREEWAAFNPSTLRAVPYQGRYLAAYVDSGGLLKAFMTDGASVARLSFKATALTFDQFNNEIYFADSAGYVYQLDGDPVNWQEFTWSSKAFLLDRATNFAACKVFANYRQLTDVQALAAQAAADAAHNLAVLDTGAVSPVTRYAAILPRFMPASRPEILSTDETKPHQTATRGGVNESLVNEFMVDGSLMVTAGLTTASRHLSILLFGRHPAGVESNPERVLLWSHDLTDTRFLRVPGDVMCDEYMVKLAGNIDVKRVEFADNVKELSSG